MSNQQLEQEKQLKKLLLAEIDSVNKVDSSSLKMYKRSGGKEQVAFHKGCIEAARVEDAIAYTMFGKRCPYRLITNEKGEICSEPLSELELSIVNSICENLVKHGIMKYSKSKAFVTIDKDALSAFVDLRSAAS